MLQEFENKEDICQIHLHYARNKGYWILGGDLSPQNPLQIDINANNKLQGRKSFMGIDESIVGLTRKICTL